MIDSYTDLITVSGGKLTLNLILKRYQVSNFSANNAAHRDALLLSSLAVLVAHNLKR